MVVPEVAESATVASSHLPKRIGDPAKDEDRPNMSVLWLGSACKGTSQL